MKARYKSLANLLQRSGGGFVTTNQYGNSIKKEHLLEMRKEGLVFYVDARDPVLKLHNIVPRGPDYNANFYSITIKGLMLLRELDSSLKTEIDAVLHEFFDDFIFQESKSKIIEYRLGKER